MWAAAKGTQRLNTLVKSLLLRRTKEQTGSEGRPLVSLPAKRVVSHRLQLSPRERLVYDKIFHQSRSVCPPSASCRTACSSAPASASSTTCG